MPSSNLTLDELTIICAINERKERLNASSVELALALSKIEDKVLQDAIQQHRNSLDSWEI